MNKNIEGNKDLKNANDQGVGSQAIGYPDCEAGRRMQIIKTDLVSINYYFKKEMNTEAKDCLEQVRREAERIINLI